jgi:uncharacterized protein (UPF0210 family)
MGHSEESMPEDRRHPSALAREKISTSELKIQLSRNPVEQNWSVEINNKRYCLIPFEIVKQLVDQALSDSKKSLIERRAKKTC